MNNPNSYQQPQQVSPQQPVPQYPQQPQMPYAYPQPVKPKFFDREMVSILACALSASGFGLSIVAGIIAGNATYIFGLITVIVSFVFSVAGFIMSLVLGNHNVKAGQPRGTFNSWGLIFGAAGILMFIFLIFFSSCMTCYYSKRGGIQW